MEPFKITEPQNNVVPILISMPHCGSQFPEEVRDGYDRQLVKSVDDTDWYVDRLYDFASGMGITTIQAVYSRWVIDLNRDTENKPLYTDGRLITELVPLKTFAGKSLYHSGQPDQREIRRRTRQYYLPYHKEIEKQLQKLKKQFGKVLLWEAHTIRQYVPTIHPQKFPDLILGDADGTSASCYLTATALNSFRDTSFQLAHNAPFKGGFITRKYGDPGQNIHALQLEMTKINYMDDAELHYDEVRSNRVKKALIKTFEALIRVLK